MIFVDMRCLGESGVGGVGEIRFGEVDRAGGFSCVGVGVGCVCIRVYMG